MSYIIYNATGIGQYKVGDTGIENKYKCFASKWMPELIELWPKLNSKRYDSDTGA